ncbi:hypothetical protein V8E51_001626 [Hyaloscypha variabilis]
MAVADLEAAVAVGPQHPQRPPEAYTRSSNRPEPFVLAAVPENHEICELRQRLQTESLPTARVPDEESSPEISPTLTPSSNAGVRGEDSGLLSMVKRVSYSLPTLLKSTSSPRPTPEEIQEPDVSRGFDKLKFEKVDDYLEGYRQHTTFANSCDTFTHIRRFKMEKTLDELDKKGANDEQRKLVSKISATYARYADIALKDAGLRALGKCPPGNAKALQTWIWNEKPLSSGAGKSDFIFYPDDLVSLAEQSQHERPFQDSVEAFLDRYPVSWIKNFLQRDIETRRKTDDEYIDHYSHAKLRLLANILEVSMAVIILLIPVFLLFLIPMSKPMMATVTALFVILFSVVVSSVTGTKVQEVFFGSAAYAAVITMFLGNLNSSSTVAS